MPLFSPTRSARAADHGLRRTATACALVAGLALSACQRTNVPQGAVDKRDVQYALSVLAAAPNQGFAPGAFGEQQLAQLWKAKGAAATPDRDRDRQLHDALIAYARAEHGLRIPARAFLPDWGLKPAPYDAEASLRDAIQAGRFHEWLDGQPPPSAQYRALQTGYATYLKIYAAGGWPTLGLSSGLKAGAGGPGVAALRQRLAFEDATVAASGPFDAPLAAAVSRFQVAHGLTPSGVVDAPTLQELNVPAQTRAAQIRANLERLRWLPREEPATRIDVNTAAATFDYFVDGKPAMHMLAASGKPGDETPILTSAIDAIVLNPPWNVPDTIAKDELMPKEAAEPGYLAAHGFTQTDDGKGGSRLVQQPSGQSALGLVKFSFPNPYSVYLHDTPSKAAFDKTQRAVSHGCVRLEQAVAFAKLLLSAQSGWSPARVDQVLAAGQTTEVKLDRHLPVRLLYLTAFPQAGRIAFRPDIYGWDARLLPMLDAPPPAGTRI